MGPRDVKMENLLLTGKGTLKIGMPARDPVLDMYS